MEFLEKYISAGENLEKPDPKKIVVSDEIFALGELLNDILRQLKRLELNK